MAKLENFVLDVDGVLTSGSFFYSEKGKVFKVFGPHDAYALKMISKKIKVHFISADHRGFEISKKRISDMGFEITLVSEEDRLSYIKNNFKLDTLVYMGDGEADALIFDYVNISIAPKNARLNALNKATFVTHNIGGKGAVADACEYLEDIL